MTGSPGRVQQRHHAEPDIAGGDTGIEVAVQQVGRLRRRFVRRLPALLADRQDLELDEPNLAV
jgi:hypothetical protein